MQLLDENNLTIYLIKKGIKQNQCQSHRHLKQIQG